jgi:fatty acid desaturase
LWLARLAISVDYMSMNIDNSRQSILPAKEVTALCKRSDRAGAVQFVAHLAALAVAFALVRLAIGTWWVWPAMIVQGVIQVALFAGLHECVHRTAFRSRRLNDLVAAITGLIAGLPAGYFRRFHFAHHRHTQDPANDPEMSAPKPTTLGRYLLYLTAYYYWRERMRELLRHAAGRVDAAFIPIAERRAIVREARIHLTVYAAATVIAVAGISDLPLYNWLLPALLGQPFLRAYLLAEHTGCTETSDMLANTRTTLTVAPVRWLMWNMPYHTEHHVFPAVPFHALPSLHARMRGKLAIVSPGYAAFHAGYGRALRSGHGAGFVHPAAPTSG